MSGRLRVLLCCLAALAAATCHAESLTPARQQETLQSALDAFDEAVASMREDPAKAKRLYQQAAAAYESLLASGLSNAGLHYNLANTYFRIGELGRAILHYRRAEKLEPNDERTASNLKYARDRVEPFITPSGQRQLTERLLFWTRYASASWRLWMTAVAGGLGWLLLACWLRWRRTSLAASAALLIIFGLLNAASLGFEMRQDALAPPAVLVGKAQTLRLGRGEGADPALSQPLGPGVEVRILEQRGDWVEVRLVDDKRGWLPASAVARV